MSKQPLCYIGRVDYQKLASCSIRMIEFVAREPGEPLRATLESVCLDSYKKDEHFTYNALSYTWSSDDRDFPLILNDKHILITQQLGRLFEDAQRNLTDGAYMRYWVDQLCINQDDDEDKAQQVPHMRRIYENATTTPIWLFPNFENGQLVMSLITRLFSLACEPESGNMLEHVPLSEILGNLNEKTLRAWRGLNQLMSHRYWTRTWILPEATTNVKSCFVVCTTVPGIGVSGVGVYEVFWMRNFLRHLWNRKPPLEYKIDEIPSSLVGLVDNFYTRRERAGTGQSSLFQLLWLSRRSWCTRQEDKIFAMLPFASDVGDYTNDPFLRPSYAQGCRRTYSDLIKWYIMKYRNLNFLGSCTATKYSTAQIPGFDLPSWVPNWTHNSFSHPLPKYDNSDGDVESRMPLYRACGSYSYSVDIVEPPAVDFEANTLFLSGLRVAIVHKVLEAGLDGGFCQPEIEMTWQNEFDGDVKYPLTEETYTDAFERTVVVNTVRSNVTGPVSRPGKVAWPIEESGLTSDKRYERDFRLKAATADRKLIFARSDPLPVKEKVSSSKGTEISSARLGATCSSFLIGLGRSDVEVGDEIWALKGGQVFYVLRRYGSYKSRNIADLPESGWPSHPSILWLNGKLHAWNETLEAPLFRFVGECYVHGLMDGEALEISSQQPAERPDVLRNISAEFEEIFAGNVGRSQTVIKKDSCDMEEAFEDALAMRIRELEVADGETAEPEIACKKEWTDVWEVI